MGNHYIRRFDLSKYSLKSFDDSNEICCDKNNNDVLTYDANGTQKVVLDNTTTSQALTSPINFGQTAGAVAGGANVTTDISKTVTGISDNTATTVFTVTVPNAAHAVAIELTFLASLGAGGAIGAFQESLVAFGIVVATRTAGVNAVATAGTLTNAADAKVAGSDAAGSLAYSVGAVSGAVGAVNTFTIQVTIAHGAGASTNHQVIAIASVINANASGVTVA